MSTLLRTTATLTVGLLMTVGTAGISIASANTEGEVAEQQTESIQGGSPAIQGGSPVCDDEITEGLEVDAASYSRSYGVSHNEAVRRMCWQGTHGPVIERLKALDRDRFAAASINHERSFGLVVTFTGDELPEGVKEIVDKAPLPVLVRAGAAFSQDKAERIQRKVSAALEDHPTAFGSYYDVKSEEFAIYMVGDESDPSSLRDSLPDTLPAQAQNARIEARPSRFGAQRRGGLRLDTFQFEPECTSGFPVVDNSDIDTKGVLTAAHCEDDLVSVIETSAGDLIWAGMGFEEEVRGSDRDVQWHTTDDVEPEFHANRPDTTRLVGPRITREQQNGMYVCHRGMTTGYSCGTVESITYDGHCEVEPCEPTWVLVAAEDGGDNALECDAGDSGGPWFNADRPTGIHTAGPMLGCGHPDTPREAIYMAIDFIDELEVTLYYASP